MSKSSNKNMWINNELDLIFVFALAKQYCKADKCTISHLWIVGSYTSWTYKGYSREVQRLFKGSSKVIQGKFRNLFREFRALYNAAKVLDDSKIAELGEWLASGA